MNNQVRNNRTSTPPLRRYTNLAAVIHHLHTKTITLLDPATWDDRNDAHFLQQYKSKQNAKTVLALCFTEQTDRYHYWHVFARGVNGVCIQFDKELLLNTLNEEDGFKHRLVDYKSIDYISEDKPELKDLPFLKRKPYKDEKEYRIIYIDKHKTMENKPINIEISWINRITLSPWMPKALVDSTKVILKSIDDCGELKIFHSTLTGNEKWKKAAD